mgnify:CR=1 FL=1
MAKNAGKKTNPDFCTTEQAFGEKLHTYTIVDAINDGNVLPLRKEDKVALIGDFFANTRYQGAGSSLIRPTKLVAPIDAFKENDVSYHYEKGYNVSSFEIDDKLENSVLNELDKFDTVLFFGGFL